MFKSFGRAPRSVTQLSTAALPGWLHLRTGGQSRQHRPSLAQRPRPTDTATSPTSGLTLTKVWPPLSRQIIASLLALDAYNLPYALVAPVLRVNIIVSGAWGIFVFREVTDPAAIATFFAGAFVVLAGAALLAVFGPQ